MSLKTRKPAMPRGLAAGGRTLWRSVVDSYELRPDEVLVLIHACRAADMVDRLHKEIAGRPLTGTGSTGQRVPHPLLAELRLHRVALAGLLKQLKLPDQAAADPDAGGANGVARSSKARAAANARWHRQPTGRGTQLD